jgi:NAD(P)-dependent dehydrogenase (short-subunit alcohol dehydrogenase family)
MIGFRKPTNKHRVPISPTGPAKRTTVLSGSSAQWRKALESAAYKWATLPEDLIEMVRFLASDASTFIRGPDINVNGGGHTY